MLKIYKISQNINSGFDTYDSAIVCAENEEEARNINPDGYGKGLDEYSYDWVSNENKDKIDVKFIGIAGGDIEKGLILASFNAG